MKRFKSSIKLLKKVSNFSKIFLVTSLIIIHIVSVINFSDNYFASLCKAEIENIEKIADVELEKLSTSHYHFDSFKTFFYISPKNKHRIKDYKSVSILNFSPPPEV